MNNTNYNSIEKYIKMPSPCALAFSKIILKYINIPALDQFIMLPNDNDTPLTFEHYMNLFHHLPIKYIYHKYLSEIVAYENVSNMDYFAILDYKTKQRDMPDFLTLSDFKFYVIDKEKIIQVELPKNHDKHLFAVFGRIKSSEPEKRVRAIAFSGLYKYNNNIFLNEVFESFRGNKKIDDFVNYMENRLINANNYIQINRPYNLFNSCADFWDKETLLVSYQNYDDLDLTDRYNIIFKQIINFIKYKVNSLDPILKKSIYEASGITCPTSDTNINEPIDISYLLTQLNNLPEAILTI